MENTSGSFEWANDSSTVYYVRKHAKTLLPYQVYRHVVGSDPQQDELIYEERDDTFYVGLEKTTSERFILIHLSSTTTSEILLLDADRADAKPQLFVPRRRIANTPSITITSISTSAPTRTARTSACTKANRRTKRSGRR